MGPHVHNRTARIASLLGFLFALLVFLALTGCAGQPDMYQRADQHPPREQTVTWCEGSGAGKKCWRVPRSEVQRVMDVLSGSGT